MRFILLTSLVLGSYSCADTHGPQVGDCYESYIDSPDLISETYHYMKIVEVNDTSIGYFMNYPFVPVFIRENWYTRKDAGPDNPIRAHIDSLKPGSLKRVNKIQCPW